MLQLYLNLSIEINANSNEIHTVDSIVISMKKTKSQMPARPQYKNNVEIAVKVYPKHNLLTCPTGNSNYK